MNPIDIRDLALDLSSIIGSLGDHTTSGPILVTRDGQPEAVIMRHEDYAPPAAPAAPAYTEPVHGTYSGTVDGAWHAGDILYGIYGYGYKGREIRDRRTVIGWWDGAVGRYFYILKDGRNGGPFHSPEAAVRYVKQQHTKEAEATCEAEA